MLLLIAAILRFRRVWRPHRAVLAGIVCLVCGNASTRAQTESTGAQPDRTSGGNSNEASAAVTATKLPAYAAVDLPPSTNQTRLISLRECIDLALARNLSLQAARLGPEVARYSLKSYYGMYDPVLSLQASRTYTDQPENFDPKKLNSTRAALDLEFEETVDKVGPSLGGVLPFGLQYNFYAYSEPENAFTVSSGIRTNNYYGVAGLGVSLPLLRGFLIDAERRNLTLARSSLKISEWQLRAQLISAASQVKEAYYNLILAREGIVVNRLLLDRAEQLAGDVHKRVEARGLSPLEEPRVQSQVELARTALFGAEQEYLNQVNALWNLISDDYSAHANTELIPADALIFFNDIEPRDSLRETALASSPQIWEMKLNLEKQDVVLRYDRNQRLPDLSLRAGYGRHSIQPDWGATLDEIGRGPHDFYSIASVLSFPIGNISARNRLKADLAAKQQLVLSYRKLQQDTIVAVDAAANALETAARQINSSRKAREFAELALDAENRLFAAGRSTIFLVLERQTALAQARLAELQALAKFNVAKAELERVQGVTLEKSGVDLDLK